MTEMQGETEVINQNGWFLNTFSINRKTDKIKNIRTLNNKHIDWVSLFKC